MRRESVGRDRSTVGEITRGRREEVRREVWKLRSGKAGGMCDIQGEAGEEVVVKWLQEIYNIIWRTGVAPLHGLAECYHCTNT